MIYAPQQKEAMKWKNMYFTIQAVVAYLYYLLRTSVPALHVTWDQLYPYPYDSQEHACR